MHAESEESSNGIDSHVLKVALDVSREFFKLSLEEKDKHTNDPITNEGYVSRLRVQKDIFLDWGDYYYHHLFPLDIRNESKWPSAPTSYR